MSSQGFIGGFVRSAIAAALLASATLSGTANAGPTLDKINQRGTIKVGVGTTPGFFSPDSNGRWQGFFIDYGRALSIAVFGNPDKVEFTNSSPSSACLRCRAANSISCFPASRSPLPVPSNSASTSARRFSMTARASSFAKISASQRPPISMAPPSALRAARPANSTSPTSSARPARSSLR